MWEGTGSREDYPALSQARGPLETPTNAALPVPVLGPSCPSSSNGFSMGLPSAHTPQPWSAVVIQKTAWAYQ
jgi:hypothetical protein